MPFCTFYFMGVMVCDMRSPLLAGALQAQAGSEDGETSAPHGRGATGWVPAAWLLVPTPVVSVTGPRDSSQPATVQPCLVPSLHGDQGS